MEKEQQDVYQLIKGAEFPDVSYLYTES